MRNALLRLERRGRPERGPVDADLALLEANVSFAQPLDAVGLARTVALSRTTELGVCDAVYLELASRDGAELASRDTALLAASAAAGLTVHDLR